PASEIVNLPQIKVWLWTHLKRDESLGLWKRSASRSHLGDSLIPGLASESSCNQPRLQRLKKNLAMRLKCTASQVFVRPLRCMCCGICRREYGARKKLRR